MDYFEKNLVETEAIEVEMADKLINFMNQKGIYYEVIFVGDDEKWICFNIKEEDEYLVYEKIMELKKGFLNKDLSSKIEKINKEKESKNNILNTISEENLHEKHTVKKEKTIENRKKNKRITLRMEEKDYLDLLKKVDESGKNITDFLNELIKKGYVRTLDIPIPTEEMIEELHEIKHEMRALRTTNGKAVGLIKKAIKLNEVNEKMDESDILYLKKYLNELNNYNKEFDLKIIQVERELLNLWQS